MDKEIKPKVLKKLIVNDLNYALALLKEKSVIRGQFSEIERPIKNAVKYIER
jgi:hypothetical protein